MMMKANDKSENLMCDSAPEHIGGGTGRPDSSVTHAGPSVIVLNDQGGQMMDVSVKLAACLRAQDHGHPPTVCYAIDHVITTGGNCTAQGPCVYDDLCPTLKASGAHAVCFAWANSAHAGITVGNKSQTIKACTGGTPAVCFQTKDKEDEKKQISLDLLRNRGKHG